MKRALITGVCGTIGSKILQALLERDDVEEVIGIDNHEAGLFFQEHAQAGKAKARFHLCDIRNENKLADMMHGVDTVYHTAAYKHVWLCEDAPFEAVQTNILGVENTIRAAKRSKVSRVIFTSSDKAVNPTNVMGASKLMGEKLITAANNGSEGDPVFASTRFGNVLGSSGSVVPVFREQIKRGGPVTLTDPAMTRFVMSIDQAARLVVDSGDLALGGEVFVTKIPAIRIEDLAMVMIEELAPLYGHAPDDIALENIGAKPGEKLWEELMFQEETRRVVELERYFAILPAFKGLYRRQDYSYPGTTSIGMNQPYNSHEAPALGRQELAAFLRENKLLDEPVMAQNEPDYRYWPSDKGQE